jgi:hypothetical protein
VCFVIESAPSTKSSGRSNAGSFCKTQPDRESAVRAINRVKFSGKLATGQEKARAGEPERA